MQHADFDKSQVDCLSIELTGTPVSQQPDGTPYLDLNLTLCFKEAWQQIDGGWFKFGLTGGKLVLNLENATIPEGLSLLTTAIELTGEESQSVSCQVAIATETQPSWIFTLNAGTSLLNGELGLVKLARLHLTQMPVRVVATFEVTAAEVQILETEGLWLHDISPNKQGVLHRMLTRSLVELKYQPYLKRAELKYASESESAIATEEMPETADGSLSAIAEAIAPIVSAPTHSLIELAKLANLNLAEDFAGAKLWGIELRGADLSGANLAEAKLRGADLTDADLTEANLTGVHLAGADLSGALLSDANLTDADLHRCSLALANLSGAILTNANLQEANLSNANLSDADLREANLAGADLRQAGFVLTKLEGANLTGANVERARFKLDSGLSEEMERDLKARGAIFEA